MVNRVLQSRGALLLNRRSEGFASARPIALVVDPWRESWSVCIASRRLDFVARVSMECASSSIPVVEPESGRLLSFFTKRHREANVHHSPPIRVASGHEKKDRNLTSETESSAEVIPRSSILEEKKPLPKHRVVAYIVVRKIHALCIYLQRITDIIRDASI